MANHHLHGARCNAPRLFSGVMPFVVADIVRLGVLVAFPAITLTLPHYLG